MGCPLDQCLRLVLLAHEVKRLPEIPYDRYIGP
jgi:hypothetical protein